MSTRRLTTRIGVSIGAAVLLTLAIGFTVRWQNSTEPASLDTELGSTASRSIKVTNSTNATTSTLIVNGLSNLTGSASTSPFYLYFATTTTDGTSVLKATSTILVLDRVEDTEQIALDIQFHASSTAAGLSIVPYVSNDGIDWFIPANNALYSSIATINTTAANHSNLFAPSGTTTIVYQPLLVGINRIQVTVANPIGRYFRLDVSANGTSTVWMQAVQLIRTQK